ncbi:hypothetical protein WJX77_009981 [Trebouxia sp. C0004]
MQVEDTDQRLELDRRIPFERQPLWTVAAVSSHQDVLEASHCASLTAGLRQLAGVVQLATTAFEKLHGQSTRLMERCQQAEVRCTAMQQSYVLVQSGKAGNKHLSQPADNQASVLTVQGGYKANDMGTHTHTRPVEVPEAIKAYRQLPAITDFSATPMLVASAQLPDASQTVATADVLSATAAKEAPQPAQMLTPEDTAQKAAIQRTVPLNEVTAGVQQMLLSDANQTSQAQLLCDPAISKPADADDMEVHIHQSSAAVPLLASQQGTGQTVQSSTLTQSNTPASPVLQTRPTAPDFFQVDGTVHTITSEASSVSEARGAAASLYEDATPQDSFTSASGFYSPRSQMASRKQSASSSDAWYDASSQMTSRTPSVTAPAPDATVPSSQSTGSRSRGVQGRLSTKDLIADLRKRQGLPPADAAPQQLAVQQVITETHDPAAAFHAGPITAVGQAPMSALMVQSLPQQSIIATDTSLGLSLEASEAHTTSQHPQQGEAVSVVAAGQPVLPQSALLELVSNPLYAKSLDASRTTSTSPTRLDTSTLVKQAELGAEDSEIPMDNSLLQVSDQPILPGSEATQATMEPMVAAQPAELHLSEQPLASPKAFAHGAADAPGPATDDTAVLQVSDQPILSTTTAASAVTQGEASVEQFSDQPLLPAQPAQPTVLVYEQRNDIFTMGLPEAGTGEVVAVSDEPILSLAGGSSTEGVQAEPVPVVSRQPMLGPVVTHTSLATHQLLSLQQSLATEPQQQVQQLNTVQTARAKPMPEMSSQPLLGVVCNERETKQLLDQPEAESVSSMSREPVLGSVTSHTESSLTQQVLQETLMQATELQQAATKPIANATVPAEQTDGNAEGLMLRPPVPALPTVRRSRSDLRTSLQSQSSSVRRSMSILPAVPEAPQPPQRSSPVPQLRRSVTSLQASPVPIFDHSLVAPKAEPQQALTQQNPVMMLAPFMSQVQAPLGPLQQGMPAPSLTQAHDRGLALPTSSTSVLMAPPVPAVLLAPAPAISAQQGQIVVPTAPLQAQQPGQLQVGTLQPLPPLLVQESRSFESVSPQHSPGAVSIDQAAPVFMSAERSADFPMQQQTSHVVHSLETSYPQMVQTAFVQQQPPIFMSSIDAGLPQQAAPPPVPIPAPRAYSPTQFLRSNTWSPSPGVLQPAKPGQAVAAPQVDGPLSMGVQPSWNSLAPSQPPPIMVPQLAIEQEAYARAQPIASAAAAQQVFTSREFPPVTAPASRAMHQQPGQVRQQQGPVSRILYQQSSLPSPEALRAAAVAANSREMYPQLGPLTGGLTEPGFPVRRELYQQVSLPSSASMHAAAHSREMYPQLGPLSGGLSQQTLIPGQRPNYQVSLPMADPMRGVTAHEGAVIQPVNGPVVVGEQSAAVTTEPLVMHSQGYSIQPLQSAVGPSGGMRQMARDMHPNASRSNGLAQMQFGALQQTGGVHAKRALEAFGRVSRSSLNADASVNNSYQSDRDTQQGYASEPQPAQRAESPPTPAVPPVSYFLNTEPVVTSYITPLPQPVAMPGPPAFSMAPLYPGPGQIQVGATPPRRSGRGPVFPAHLRSAVTSMQNPASIVQPVSSAQWATNAPPVVLPRVAVAGPTPNYPQINSWSAASSTVMPSYHQQQGSIIIDSQQALGSQDSSAQFRFLPGQRSSQDSQSTPSLSNRSVPRFLEEAWARGEPQQQGPRQAPSMPPPPSPPPPGAGIVQMQGLAGQRQSQASNALAGWHGSGSQAAAPLAAPQAAPQQQALLEEPSLYQSPLSHQSVSSFGSPSPRPATAMPSQLTPATPQAPPMPAGVPNALLASIQTGQFHLRKMSQSFNGKGIASSSNAQGASTSQGSASGQAATLASLPPTGPYPRNRRNSGSTVGMDTAVARRMQANRQSMYPESTYSESEWGD